MNTEEIRQQLMQAFGVDTNENLRKHLTKTDFYNREEMLHAAAVVWNGGDRYEIKNRSAIRRILDAQDPEVQRKLAIDAKHGFGYCDATKVLNALPEYVATLEKARSEKVPLEEFSGGFTSGQQIEVEPRQKND